MNKQKKIATSISIIIGIVCLVIGIYLTRFALTPGRDHDDLYNLAYLVSLFFNLGGLLFLIQGIGLLVNECQSAFIGYVIKAGSVVIDINNEIDILKEDAWGWNWPFKKNYAGCRIFGPLSSKAICIRHLLMGSGQCIHYWGYCLLINAPSDIDNINLLRQAIDDDFYQWQFTAEKRLLPLLGKHLNELTDILLRQEDGDFTPDSIRLFDTKARELVESELSAMGLKLADSKICAKSTRSFCGCNFR